MFISLSKLTYEGPFLFSEQPCICLLTSIYIILFDTELARRPCGIDGIWWEKSDLSRCVSAKAIQLRRRKAQHEPMTNMVPEVVEMSHQPVYGGDVVELTSLMTDIVNQVEVEVGDMGEQAQQQTTQNVSQVSDKVYCRRSGRLEKSPFLVIT